MRSAQATCVHEYWKGRSSVAVTQPDPTRPVILEKEGWGCRAATHDPTPTWVDLGSVRSLKQVFIEVKLAALL
jgi:hypothetical protein